VLRLRPAFAGDEQIIAPPRQLDRIRNIFVRRIGLATRSAVDHAHAEGGAAIGNGAADAAEPEHAHGLATDAAPERDRTFARPAAVAHVAIGEQDLPRRSEHQADGQVGDFVRQDTRRIGHGYVALARGGEIDAIGSDAEHGNHFELGKRRDQRAIGAAVGLGRDASDVVLEIRGERIRAGRCR
jgi:hypothetical protein